MVVHLLSYWATPPPGAMDERDNGADNGGTGTGGNGEWGGGNGGNGGNEWGTAAAMPLGVLVADGAAARLLPDQTAEELGISAFRRANAFEVAVPRGRATLYLQVRGARDRSEWVCMPWPSSTHAAKHATLHLLCGLFAPQTGKRWMWRWLFELVGRARAIDRARPRARPSRDVLGARAHTAHFLPPRRRGARAFSRGRARPPHHPPLALGVIRPPRCVCSASHFWRPVRLWLLRRSRRWWW